MSIHRQTDSKLLWPVWTTVGIGSHWYPPVHRLCLRTASIVNWYRCFSDGDSSLELLTLLLLVCVQTYVGWSCELQKPEPGQKVNGPLRISQSRHNSLPFTEYSTKVTIFHFDSAKQKKTLTLSLKLQKQLFFFHQEFMSASVSESHCDIFYQQIYWFKIM